MLDPTAESPLSLLRPAVPEGPHLDRRLGRALAFQSLYEVDLARHGAEQVLERLAMPGIGGAEYPADTLEAALAYARWLVQGVGAHRDEIDRMIQQRAPAFPLAQMSAVDRNVLRLGLYEALFGGGTVPLRAAINEAVELAKHFGSETSGKFVNGVLGRAVEGHSASSEAAEPQPQEVPESEERR